MNSITKIFLFYLSTISIPALATNITGFDIEGLNLRSEYSSISNKYPCNQQYGRFIEVLQACSVKDNKRIHEKMVEKSFLVVFGVTNEAMRIRREITIESDRVSEIKKEEIFKKYGQPAISANFTVNNTVYSSHCWGDCTQSGSEYVRGKNGGPSYVYSIKQSGINNSEHSFELEDRELFQKFWAWEKSRK